MTTRKPPRLVPSEDLPAYFLANGIAFTAGEPLPLGAGEDGKRYRLYSYPAPADDETMGVFCEWHTEDFFDTDTGPHVAIGMRGPAANDPHRGRGLAIGILANQAPDPGQPGRFISLFKGCPDAPGGPSFFIEDFTVNDGIAPVEDWQLSRGQDLPLLHGNGIYRIDIHVSLRHVWAGVWKVTGSPSAEKKTARHYAFLGATACARDSLDRGCGNAFIGSGFADPKTRSWVDNIFIAHWKT